MANHTVIECGAGGEEQSLLSNVENLLSSCVDYSNKTKLSPVGAFEPGSTVSSTMSNNENFAAAIEEIARKPLEDGKPVADVLSELDEVLPDVVSKIGMSNEAQESAPQMQNTTKTKVSRQPK